MVKYGGYGFLFMGDAEDSSEAKLLEAGYDLSADALKVGHHGGATSAGEAFLTAVSPSIAVISVGSGNSYGHPHEEALQRLIAAGADIYRTDIDGSIVISVAADGHDGDDGLIVTTDSSPSDSSPTDSSPSDGSPTDSAPSETAVVETTTEISEQSAAEQQHAYAYIGNKNSKTFHRPTCSSLPAEKNRVYLETREEAVEKGYNACKICKP